MAFIQPCCSLIANPSEYERELELEHRKRLGFLFPDPDIAQKEKEQRKLFLETLVANGVATFDLQEAVERPHEWGEMFLDLYHVTYRGNHCIAQEVFRRIHLLSPVNVEKTDDKSMRAMLTFMRGLHIANPYIIPWLDTVPRFTNSPTAGDARTGAIVMNCNPFTLGHKHIIQTALQQVDRLYIFLVEEDKSFFSFLDRWQMASSALAEFGDKVIMAPSGKHIISAITFPEYFQKDAIDYTPDTTMEIVLFGVIIAPALGISVRFFGEEPNCRVTQAHHQQMREILPYCDIEVMEIPRLRHEEEAISASKVRALLQDGAFTEIGRLVPHSTLRYLVQNHRPEKNLDQREKYCTA
jgi:[citrate (pro-3S)-lyase] ligase